MREPGRRRERLPVFVWGVINGHSDWLRQGQVTLVGKGVGVRTCSLRTPFKQLANSIMGVTCVCMSVWVSNCLFFCLVTLFCHSCCLCPLFQPLTHTLISTTRAFPSEEILKLLQDMCHQSLKRCRFFKKTNHLIFCADYLKIAWFFSARLYRSLDKNSVVYEG